LTISFGIVNGETFSGPRLLHLDLAQAPDPGSQDHAAAEGIFAGEIEPRVPDRVDSRDHRKLGEAVQPLDLLAGDVPLGREVDDLPGEPDPEPRGVEQLQRVHAALAIADTGPHLLHLAAERSDQTQSRYDNAPFHGSLSGRRSSAFFVDRPLNVLNGLPDRLDLLGGIVRDVDVELLFQLHDQLDRVERVGSQVIDERCVRVDLILADAQLLGDDINYSFCD
jgi:hypothetical protein